MSVELEEADLPLTEAEESAGGGGGGSSSLSPSKKKKNNKKKNQPGKYSQLVVETIRKLGERNGSSLQNGRTYLKYSIKALVQNDTLLQVKGTGANGSFKLNRKKLEGGGDGGAGSTAALRRPRATWAGSRRPRPPPRPSRRAPRACSRPFRKATAPPIGSRPPAPWQRPGGRQLAAAASGALKGPGLPWRRAG
uniref:H1.10 linker histone n=1 Tax=Anas platyrhynchos TaxID=8839 RepID=A0A8B9T1X6_ANAPL